MLCLCISRKSSIHLYVCNVVSRCVAGHAVIIVVAVRDRVLTATTANAPPDSRLCWHFRQQELSNTLDRIGMWSGSNSKNRNGMRNPVITTIFDGPGRHLMQCDLDHSHTKTASFIQPLCCSSFHRCMQWSAMELCVGTVHYEWSISITYSDCCHQFANIYVLAAFVHAWRNIHIAYTQWKMMPVLPLTHL